MIEKQELDRVLFLISWWLTAIKSHNAIGFFDINNIAEGVALKLLNEIYDYQLENLNFKKKNFPGIDLGDRSKKIGFQITSRSDAQKIRESLETFVKKPYKIFPNGIRFLILNQENKPELSKAKYQKICKDFSPDVHVLNANDLIEGIRKIYETEKDKFYRIKNMLELEIGPKAIEREKKDERQKRNLFIANGGLVLFAVILYLIFYIFFQHPQENHLRLFASIDKSEVKVFDDVKLTIEAVFNSDTTVIAENISAEIDFMEAHIALPLTEGKDEWKFCGNFDQTYFLQEPKVITMSPVTKGKHSSKAVIRLAPKKPGKYRILLMLKATVDNHEMSDTKQLVLNVKFPRFSDLIENDYREFGYYVVITDKIDLDSSEIEKHFPAPVRLIHERESKETNLLKGTIWLIPYYSTGFCGGRGILIYSECKLHDRPEYLSTQSHPYMECLFFEEVQDTPSEDFFLGCLGTNPVIVPIGSNYYKIWTDYQYIIIQKQRKDCQKISYTEVSSGHGYPFGGKFMLNDNSLEFSTSSELAANGVWEIFSLKIGDNEYCYHREFKYGRWQVNSDFPVILLRDGKLIEFHYDMEKDILSVFECKVEK